MTELVKEYASCRACGHGELHLVLDLGNHAVSDFYDRPPDNELKAPLRLLSCGKCGLVQLSHSVAKDRLYKNYWYHSSGNEVMVSALKDIVEDAKRWTYLTESDSVLDIGCNDGTLLDLYADCHSRLKRYGIEPSNLWEFAHARGFPIINGYYPTNKFDWDYMAEDRPMVITSIAMFYDLDNPIEFVQAIKEDLNIDGVWINQMMDLDGMLLANAVDNICHEHVTYWSTSNFTKFVSHSGLYVIDMSHNNVNGGSVRFYIGHREGPPRNRTGGTLDISAFAASVEKQKNLMMAFLEECRQDGKLVLGYGASTKGNTLLQYYDITTDLLPAIAERNPEKIGKVTAGQHIPIISEQDMRELKPDYLLILPWAFLDNFLIREKELREQGTKFIVPLPEFRVM